MFRIFTVMLMTLAVAALGVAGFDTRAARADDESLLADHFFHVEWTADPAGASGRTRITGYVYNDSGDAAVNVALRFHEIDASGRDVASEIAPVRETIPANGRAYFDVRVPSSRSYRVDVSSFDFLELAG
jgi:hypothetical protein